jgi:hypothetical protein
MLFFVVVIVVTIEQEEENVEDNSVSNRFQGSQTASKSTFTSRLTCVATAFLASQSYREEDRFSITSLLLRCNLLLAREFTKKQKDRKKAKQNHPQSRPLHCTRVVSFQPLDLDWKDTWSSDADWLNCVCELTNTPSPTYLP